VPKTKTKKKRRTPQKRRIRREAELERIAAEDAARAECDECSKYECGNCEAHPRTERIVAARATEPKARTSCAKLLPRANSEPVVCGRTEGCFNCCAALGIASGAAERARQGGVPWLLSDHAVSVLISVNSKCKKCGVSLALGAEHPREDAPAIYRLDATLPYTPENVRLGCVACVGKMSAERPGAGAA
jgi:hypothetical protein